MSYLALMMHPIKLIPIDFIIEINISFNDLGVKKSEYKHPSHSYLE